MTHSFNVEIASKYGIEEAILIEYFVTCINGEYYFPDGCNIRFSNPTNYICLPCETRAILTMFPEFLSEHKIRKLMKSLVEQGVFFELNFHYRNLLWYSFTKSAIDMLHQFGMIAEDVFLLTQKIE